MSSSRWRDGSRGGMLTRRPSAARDSPRNHAGPAEPELVPQGLALDYAHGWGTLTWRMAQREPGPEDPGCRCPGEEPGDRARSTRADARPPSLVRKLTRTLSGGADSPGSKPRFTACQVAISKDGKDSMVHRRIRYDPEAKEHTFAASIEVGRPGAYSISVRVHDEVQKDWTPWSERLDGEAVEEQKQAVRPQQLRLSRPHPHLPQDYYRGKLRALRERKVPEGISSEFSRTQSEPTRSSHDVLGDMSKRRSASCLHATRHIVTTLATRARVTTTY